MTWQQLAAGADAKNEALWLVLPKHHYVCHVVDDLSNRLNPRLFANFLDEDFLGKIKKLGRKTNSKTASLRILQRYLVYVSHRWKRRQESGGFRCDFKRGHILFETVAKL